MGRVGISAMAGSTVGDGQESGRTEFAIRLRAAIATSGLSLDRIQARLRARGVVVSVTALSYWQSGKRQPERQSSLSAVRKSAHSATAVVRELSTSAAARPAAILAPPLPARPK